MHDKEKSEQRRESDHLKELTCFYEIAHLVETPGITLEEILQGTVDLLPKAWEVSECLCAWISLPDQEFKTRNWEHTPWKLSSTIRVQGKGIGTIQVNLLKETPDAKKGIFLQSKRDLLDSVAERVGRIIERMGAEEELRRLNQELEQRIQERTAELEGAKRDLEAFSYALANQVVKSLMTIAENADIISSQNSGKEHEVCRRYSRRIYDKTKFLGELIGSMYEYFSLSKRVLNRERINLSEIAAKTAEEHKKARPERPITFKITSGIEVNGDKDLLREVLSNLFENSLAHTNKSEEAVIEFGIREEVDGEKTYFVHDNGEGFNMERTKDLFIPFQHLQKAGEFRGFGVGLATVEKIIRRHGGRTWAEGGPDGGATIYFTLLP